MVTRAEHSHSERVWYAFQTLPQKEFAARDRLKRQGYFTALPVEHKWRRANSYSRRKVVVGYPMFTGYLFVGFITAVPWRDILSLDEIRGVVAFGGVPAALPEAAIADLVQLSAAAVPHTRSVSTHRAVRPGDTAMIAHGPLAGFLAEINAIVGKKAHVAVKMFGRHNHMTIPLEKLDAA